ncbi:hypothetical protein FQR65_LT20396 [Abscondita terminalis]|nr:hypothetical protein FQR65_LT20396 [Abscondita terminalis]
MALPVRGRLAPGLAPRMADHRHALAVLLGRRPRARRAALASTRCRSGSQLPVLVPSICWPRPRLVDRQTAVPMPRADVGWRRTTCSQIEPHGLDGARAAFNWPAACRASAAIWAIGRFALAHSPFPRRAAAGRNSAACGANSSLMNAGHDQEQYKQARLERHSGTCCSDTYGWPAWSGQQAWRGRIFAPRGRAVRNRNALRGASARAGTLCRARQADAALNPFGPGLGGAGKYATAAPFTVKAHRRPVSGMGSLQRTRSDRPPFAKCAGLWGIHLSRRMSRRSPRLRGQRVAPWAAFRVTRILVLRRVRSNKRERLRCDWVWTWGAAPAAASCLPRQQRQWGSRIAWGVRATVPVQRGWLVHAWRTSAGAAGSLRRVRPGAGLRPVVRCLAVQGLAGLSHPVGFSGGMPLEALAALGRRCGSRGCRGGPGRWRRRGARRAHTGRRRDHDDRSTPIGTESDRR